MNDMEHTATHPDAREIQSAVFDALVRITEIPLSQDGDMDTNLFDEDVLDSLGLIQLIVALSGKFGIDTPPASVERAQWATPRTIIATVTSRLANRDRPLQK